MGEVEHMCTLCWKNRTVSITYSSVILLGDNCSVPQASVAGSSSALVVPSDVQQNLNGKGKVSLPPARNPALIVKRKIVGRAIHLQKKVGSEKRAMDGERG